MEQAVYILCAATALACGTLLWRGFQRRHVRLLLWCALFFFAMSLENIILFIDLVLIPQTDFTLIRRSTALVGVLVLLYGLVWDTR